MISCKTKEETIMLKMTAATVEAFLMSLAGQGYSAATMAKYARDVRALLRNAPRPDADCCPV